MHNKVALITGGNAGIGLALAERLLQQDSSIHVCLACRNRARAEAAKEHLMRGCPGAAVSLVILDVGDLSSVYKAAVDIKERFHHLDYLYMNAGIMPGTSMDWGHFFSGLFSSQCIHMFRTGDGLLRQTDITTPDGLKQIFATNLFGHFVLIKELEGHLGGVDGCTQIMWTSSSNAKKEAFSLEDIQHKHGREPYSASKYAVDLVSVGLNEKHNSQGVYSHTTCPGLVMTNLTYGILPSWLWKVLLPIMWLLRLFTPSMNISPGNGSEALFWLAQQEPQKLDPLIKFHSRVSFTGQRYTEPIKMNIDPQVASSTFQKLDDLEEGMRPRFKS